jgi:hypothetical protein
MRYVSEKTLKDYLHRYTSNIDNNVAYQQGYSAALGFVLSMAKELPEERLRPMCDAPRDGRFILTQVDDEYEQARWNSHWDMWVFHDDLMIEDERLKGWTPMPKVVV